VDATDEVMVIESPPPYPTPTTPSDEPSEDAPYIVVPERMCEMLLCEGMFIYSLSHQSSIPGHAQTLETSLHRTPQPSSRSRIYDSFTRHPEAPALLLQSRSISMDKDDWIFASPGLLWEVLTEDIAVQSETR
jgi:hypothetical protein